jgi:hypothetical protein
MPDWGVPVGYDWFAPSVEITLLNNNRQDRFLLWMTTPELKKNAPKVGLKIPHLAVFRELTIDQQGAFFNATIQLCPNYDDAIAIMNSKLLINTVSEVEIKMGISTNVGGSTGTWVVFYARVITVQFSLGAEINITIKCVPSSQLHSETQNTDTPLNDKSRVEIIKTMWLEAGKGNKVDTTILDDPKNASTPSKGLMEQKITVTPAGKSPMAIINDMLTQTQCAMKVRDGVLTLIPRDVALSQAPNAKFQVYVGNKIGSGVGGTLPILTCSSTSDNLFAKGQYDIAIGGADAGKKEPTKNEATRSPDASNPKAVVPKTPVLAPTATPGGKASGGPKPDAMGVSAKAKRMGMKDQRHDAPVPPTDQGKDATSKLAAERTANSGIQLKVDTLFLPTLIPFSVVEVNGLSKRVDGNFLITKVTHRVGPDGGATTWEGMSTGTYWQRDQELVGQANQAKKLAAAKKQAAADKVKQIEWQLGAAMFDAVHGIGKVK